MVSACACNVRVDRGDAEHVPLECAPYDMT